MSDFISDMFSNLLDNTKEHLQGMEHDSISNLLNGFDLDVDGVAGQDLHNSLMDAIGMDNIHGTDTSHFVNDNVPVSDYAGESTQHTEYVDSSNYDSDSSFCGYTKRECMDQVEYYDKEAKNAYGWYESYLKDGSDSSASSWLNTYEQKKEAAESWRDKLKWATD